MKKHLLFLLTALFFATAATAQTAIAKLKYEDAEEAFLKDDYKTALAKLEESEKLFGNINPPILYMRILSQYNLLPENPHNDGALLMALKKNCDSYLKSYESMSNLADKYKEVYRIYDNLSIYSENANFFKARDYLYGDNGVERNLELAAEYGKKAIAEKDLSAYNLMSLISKDSLTKITWLNQGAEKGGVFALDNLGDEYAGKDDKRAFSYYEQAAQKGYPASMVSLGRLYEEGTAVPKDLQKAFEWYEKAAKKNYVAGMKAAGYAYYAGNGVQKNISAAVKLFEAAVKREDPYAQYFMAMLYKEGDGVEKNEDKYIELLTQSASGNYFTSIKLLASYYEEIKDKKQALYWKQKAGLGDKDIAYSLALNYAVADDDKQAAVWYERAAKMGHIEAAYELGEIYKEGEYLPKDPVKAFEWYQKAAAGNSTMGIFALGLAYRDGFGTPINYTKAMEYFKMEADKGSTPELKIIGHMYQDGLGVEKSYSKALEYYKKAHLQKDKSAMYYIGNLYFEGGPGIEKNIKTAIECYELAAETDYLAAGKLKRMYKNGDGVKQNDKKAEFWQARYDELMKKK